MSSRRPGGVVLIAVLAWIGSAAQIVVGALVLAGVLNSPDVSRAAAWIGLFVGVISFFVAFSLFAGRPWARVLMTVSFALSFLSAVFAVAAHPGSSAGSVVAGLTALVGIGLLYTARANDYFRS